MNEKIKTWSLRFSAKENLSMEKALKRIVLQYDVKAKYQLVLESFWAWSFFTRANRKPPKFVSNW